MILLELCDMREYSTDSCLGLDRYEFDIGLGLTLRRRGMSWISA